MRALVTGATGFIGRVLCERLLADGIYVRAAVRRGNQAVAANEVCVVGDIGPSMDWSAAVHGMDIVFHVAGRAHVRSSSESELQQLQVTNVEATAAAAGEASAAGVERFVFLSTAKVNGEISDVSGFREEDPPCPSDAYARSKAQAEQRVREQTNRHTIIRTPLVYGPGVKANFLSLLQAVDRGLPLPLKAITNRRSFIYVGNLADALLKAAMTPSASGQTYLVSDGEDVSTAELIRRIAAALGRRARLVTVPAAGLRVAASLIGRRSAVEKLIGNATVDISKIRRLGWRPPCTMKDGLAATAAWYRTRRVA